MICQFPAYSPFIVSVTHSFIDILISQTQHDIHANNTTKALTVKTTNLYITYVYK